MADPIEMLAQMVERLVNNFKQAFENFTPEKWIRLVMIVGAYLLLRPYLIKLAGRTQMQQHEKEEQEAEARAKLSSNSIRGQVDIPDNSDEEDGAQTSASDWGKKARRRQRDMLKKMVDAHEKKLAEEQEDDEDKDIEEFLED